MPVLDAPDQQGDWLSPDDHDLNEALPEALEPRGPSLPENVNSSPARMTELTSTIRKVITPDRSSAGSQLQDKGALRVSKLR